MRGRPPAIAGETQDRAELAALLRRGAAYYERGTVGVAGETVRYRLRAVDARGPARRADDERRGGPAGDVIVVVPGHGQTVRGPRRLLAAAALLSRSKIAWCIDPVPARGGDITEAQAIAAVVGHKLAVLWPGTPVAATALGWSHGGGEALRAAADAPHLFPRYVGLCPAGFIDRRPLEMVGSFGREAARSLGHAVLHRQWGYARITMQLGGDLAAGLARDLWDSRSLRAVVADVAWAARRVPGPEFLYPGDVGVVWGSRDTVVRWQDVLPGCASCDDVGSHLAGFCPLNFPAARTVKMAVFDGDHVGPEAEALLFVRAGLELVGELECECPPA